MAIDPKNYRTAGFLVERYGGQAVAIAVGRAKELSNSDDSEKFIVWANIALAVEELLRAEPAENEPVH